MKLISLRTKGFLLADALFSVFVTMMIVVILQGLLKNLSLANKSEHHTDDFVFSYVQFDRFLHNKDTETAYTLPKQSNSNEASFIKVEKKGKKVKTNNYLLSFYKNMIRVTTVSGGHMPLLLNVSRATFTTIDRQIRIRVTETDGRKSVLYFKFDPKPAKKTKEFKSENKNKAKKFVRKHLIK